jgi:GWxTD domain-containing protein
MFRIFKNNFELIWVMRYVIILCLSITSLIVNAKQLDAMIDYATFNIPGQKPYAEIYFNVIGKTLNMAQIEDGVHQGAIAVYTTVTDTNNVTVFEDAYRLNGPLVNESDTVIPNFIEQQRIALDNGVYRLSIRLIDLNDTASYLNASGTIVIDYAPNEISISDIEILEKFEKATSQTAFTKSGYDLIPYIPYTHYSYPVGFDLLNFYFEIYNSNQSFTDTGRYVVKYYLSTETDYPVSQYSRYFKKNARPVDVVLGRFDLSELPSGNYKLMVEIVDANGELVLEESVNFERVNPEAEIDLEDPNVIEAENTFASQFEDKEILADHIQSLYPISNPNQRQYAENAIASDDLVLMQKYFYGFWKNQDAYQPEKAWNKYYKQVLYVNEKYGTRLRKGYNTDRGRVFLQYGPPNDIDGRPYEPSAYPYEIWLYYTIEQNAQRNVIFVFANRELSTNTYELLHSTAQGEVYNYRWQMDIYGRNQADNNIDRENSIDHFGSSINNNVILGPR